MGEQTRPSAIARRPSGEAAVNDCTVVELLTEAAARIERLKAALAPADFPGGNAGRIAREYAESYTHLEDAITRFNKATYMERGIFAITDAERTGA